MSEISGNTFYIHSTVKLNERNDLVQAIKHAGGSVINMLTGTVTHIVVANVLKDSNDFQISKAKQAGKKVVSISWVLSRVPSSGVGSSTEPAGSTAEIGSMGPTGSYHTPQVTDISAFMNTERSYSTATGSGLDISTSGLLTPTVTKVIPPNAPVTGDVEIAVFGLNFVPGPKFRVSFGNVVATNYQFHSATSVIVKIPACNAQSGEVVLTASNDGVTWGFPTSFTFQDLGSSEAYSLSTQKITLLSGQLRNLGQVFATIQRMEAELRR